MANNFSISEEPELQIVEEDTSNKENKQIYISNIITEYEILNKRCDEIISRILSRKKQSPNNKPS